MNPIFKAPRWRVLVLIAVALALAGPFSFAQSAATPANPPTTANNATLAPKLTAPSSANINAAAPRPVTEDIRDIRGPKHIPSPWFWPLCLAGSLALAALLYLAWRWKRRRAHAVVLLPYQIALAKLEAARAQMQPENAREFSIIVSEIVRQFIEERFQARAARRTTEEFLRDLLESSDALLANHRELLADFLRHCDLAKFARWTLSKDEMETMIQSAHSFVLQTGQPPLPAASSTNRDAVPTQTSKPAEPLQAHP